MAAANGDWIMSKITGERTETGIPSTIFVDNVDTFLETLGLTSIEPVIGAQQQLYSKYKFMEANLMKTKQMFQKRVPEIERDLEMLQHLMEKQAAQEEVKTRFSLADNVYAKAKVNQSVSTVGMWLGANVMVEYDYDEANALLKTNLANATARLKSVEGDLVFLRDQIITSEVNIARIFNHDVRQKRKDRDEKLAKELTAK